MNGLGRMRREVELAVFVIDRDDTLPWPGGEARYEHLLPSHHECQPKAEDEESA
jgi:hypothetical protein